MRYLEFIEKKCKGDYLSVSDWIRKFIVNHEGYKEDSCVSEEIMNDLVGAIKIIGENNDPEYLKND